MRVLKAISKWTLAAFMITAGVMHFVADDFFLKVVILTSFSLKSRHFDEFFVKKVLILTTFS